MPNSVTDLSEILKLISTALPLLLPILLIQWGLMIYALVKLFKSETEPKYLPRVVWALIIIFVNLVGSILYLVIGRNEE